MLYSILDVSDNTRFERFCRHLILQCLNYYIRQEDLLTDQVYSKYGAYVISINFSWLKKDLEINYVLSVPSDESLRLILGQGIANELDAKAREIFNLSLAMAQENTELRSS